MTAHFDSPLWVVTSYFNPSKYKRRLENFHTFRRFLNAPLLVVELERDGEFQLTQDDGEIVIQLTGEDRIWQKERLLNIGIENLPDHVEYVAWVDCDVIFEDADWAAKAVEEFRRGANVLQPFQTVSHLKRTWKAPQDKELLLTKQDGFLNELSYCYWLDKEGFSEERLRREREGQGVAPGIAWASRRDILDQVQIYDANVIGGGDRPLAYTATGMPNEIVRSILLKTNGEQNVSWLTSAHAEHFSKWAQRFDVLVDQKNSYLPQRVYHLWHGNFANRGYTNRYKNLTVHDFDPVRDLQVSQSGPWRWTNPDSPLAKDVAAYFDTRREDG